MVLHNRTDYIGGPLQNSQIYSAKSYLAQPSSECAAKSMSYSLSFLPFLGIGVTWLGPARSSTGAEKEKPQSSETPTRRPDVYRRLNSALSTRTDDLPCP